MAFNRIRILRWSATLHFGPVPRDAAAFWFGATFRENVGFPVMPADIAGAFKGDGLGYCHARSIPYILRFIAELA
jgi:hypothetical protein